MNSVWIGKREYEVPSSYDELAPSAQVQVAKIALCQPVNSLAMIQVFNLVMPKSLRTFWHLVLLPFLYSKAPRIFRPQWFENLMQASSVVSGFFGEPSVLPVAPDGSIGPTSGMNSISLGEFIDLQQAAGNCRNEPTKEQLAELTSIVFRPKAHATTQFGDQRESYNQAACMARIDQVKFWPAGYHAAAQLWVQRETKLICEGYPTVFSTRASATPADEEASNSGEWWSLVKAVTSDPMQYPAALNTPLGYVLYHLDQVIKANKNPK